MIKWKGLVTVVSWNDRVSDDGVNLSIADSPAKLESECYRLDQSYNIYVIRCTPRSEAPVMSSRRFAP
jgi:hypothetical protein